MVIGVQSVDKVELLACILVGLKLRVHGSDSIVRVGGSERLGGNDMTDDKEYSGLLEEE